MLVCICLSVGIVFVLCVFVMFVLFAIPLACRGVFVVVFRSSNMFVCVVCLCGCYFCSS